MTYTNFYFEMKDRRYLRDSEALLESLDYSDDPSYYEYMDEEVHALREKIANEYGE